MATRRSFLAAAAALALPGAPGKARALPPRPRPTPAQLAWQQDELALFLHFGINTFTDREWGDGREDPALFAPAAVDAREWARTARRAGFRAMLLTAKHHDGFCLWPTATTRHSVTASPWRGGAGDLVREFTDACAAEGLRAGLYLSPWDRNAPAYGSGRGYDDLYCAQLEELLTRYGPIHEVWFDGANGEGPGGRRQAYDWPRYWALVRRLQPGAVIFSDAGPDIRWIGNERGDAGPTNWSTVDPAAVPFPGATGDRVMAMLRHGDPQGSVWRPGETDVSIRPGWFHHPAEDARVRTGEDLVDLYFTSVGRNSKLLLNVPPTRDGVLHATDAARLLEMRRLLDQAFAAGRRVVPGPERPVAGIVDLREDVERGQSVARYVVEGHDGAAWRTLSRGTTIGHRKLDRIPPAVVTRARVRVLEWAGPRGHVRLDLWG